MDVEAGEAGVGDGGDRQLPGAAGLRVAHGQGAADVGHRLGRSAPAGLEKELVDDDEGGVGGHRPPHVVLDGEAGLGPLGQARRPPVRQHGVEASHRPRLEPVGEARHLELHVGDGDLGHRLDPRQGLHLRRGHRAGVVALHLHGESAGGVAREAVGLAAEERAEHHDEGEDEHDHGEHGEDGAGAEAAGERVGQAESQGHGRGAASDQPDPPADRLEVDDEGGHGGRHEDDALQGEDGNLGFGEHLRQQPEAEHGPGDGAERGEGGGDPWREQEGERQREAEEEDGGTGQGRLGGLAADAGGGDRRSDEGQQDPGDSGCHPLLGCTRRLGQVADGPDDVELGDDQ